MRAFFLGSIALLALIGGPATAADMAVYKAPPPVAVYNWTGFYVGGNIGFSWGRSSNDWNIFAPAAGGGLTTICAPAGEAFCAAGSDSSRMHGPIGGFQTGYNWQSSNFLIGIETDIQISGQQGDGTLHAPNATTAIVNGQPLVGTVTASHTEKLLWLGTLRGRVGYASDRWLVYATGGLAYGRVSISSSVIAESSNLGPSCTPHPVIGAFCPVASFSNGVTKAGWTLGAGAEGVITGNWSWKMEYLHVDLGSVGTTFGTLPDCFGGIVIFPGGGGSAACAPTLAGTGTVRSRITDEIVRVGINYRFGL
jgi:outer membrane immunogenic protein